MKTTTLICLLIFFTSCSNKEVPEKTNSELSEYSFKNILSYNNKDTIFIKSRFADCGEWGGHEELIKVYRLETKINLEYIKYKVICNKMDSLGSIIQTKYITHNFTLSNSQQLSLINYFNNLMKLKFMNENYGNSGNSFLIEDCKGKLRLSHYGNNPHLFNNYNILMKSLGLSKVIIRNQ